MAQKNKIDIAGIEGNMAAQSRVFAHSAKSLTIPSGATNSVDVLDLSAAGAGDTVSVISRGACLYVGGAGDVKVGMESGDEVTVFADNVKSAYEKGVNSYFKNLAMTCSFGVVYLPRAYLSFIEFSPVKPYQNGEISRIKSKLPSTVGRFLAKE